jgi:hypothetical protein
MLLDGDHARADASIRPGRLVATNCYDHGSRSGSSLRSFTHGASKNNLGSRASNKSSGPPFAGARRVIWPMNSWPQVLGYSQHWQVS